ncbi:hypothetical protein ACIA8K_17760 [Catenuloplanes sp. NPDC051500]|uniref:hypothetical protein n=1 Tax=Catenuloplanes sp. NPDC051500 TaxID=3363959 RepID=UPI0037B0B58B
MRNASTSRLACVVALVTVLAGCTSQPARIRPGATTLTAAAAALITRTGTYYQDELLFKRIENRLSDACMAAAGFTVTTTDLPRADEEWRPMRSERERDGYRLRSSADSEDTSPTAAYLRSLPPGRQEQFHTALLGPDADRAAITLRGGTEYSFPGSGCVADARGRIFGDPMQAARIDHLAQDYHNNGYLEAVKDPAYQRALSGWAGCMAAKGHPYASPQKAKESLAAEYGPDAPPTASPHEIEVALADADCAAQARVGETVEGLLRTYAEHLDATGIAELNALAVLRQDAARRAQGL